MEGFRGIGPDLIAPFRLPLKRGTEASTYFPASSTTFLEHGHSGSPLYGPGKDGVPKLKGIFSAQEYSLDRSADTRYFFALADEEQLESIDAAPRAKEPTFNSLIPISKAGEISVQITDSHCHNKSKSLYSISFINRSDSAVSVSFDRDSLLPDLVQKVLLRRQTKKLYISDLRSWITLAPNAMLTAIANNPPIPSTISLVVKE
ncbi:MAG: hypothetical protein AB3N63_17170 [Puniceicoccaceae bacterium]